MLLIFQQSVEPTIVTTNFEVMWFNTEADVRDEMRARIENFNPKELERLRFTDQAKWEIEAPYNPCDHLHLILERVPHVVPWTGYVSRQEQLWEIVPPKDGPRCVESTK